MVGIHFDEENNLPKFYQILPKHLKAIPMNPETHCMSIIPYTVAESSPEKFTISKFQSENSYIIS